MILWLLISLRRKHRINSKNGECRVHGNNQLNIWQHYHISNWILGIYEPKSTLLSLNIRVLNTQKKIAQIHRRVKLSKYKWQKPKSLPCSDYKLKHESKQHKPESKRNLPRTKWKPAKLTKSTATPRRNFFIPQIYRKKPTKRYQITINNWTGK